MRFFIRRSMLRKVSVLCAAFLLILAGLLIRPVRMAEAFFPTNLLAVGGLLGRSHIRITEDAVKELDQEFFGITRLTRAMRKAIEQIGDANAEVDDDQTTAAKHVDGESFPEAQARLVALVGEVVSALGNDNAEGARSKLGQALHTLQDFYSHSNWIELGNGAPHPGLGRAGNVINRLPANVATCQPCTGGLPPVLCPDCSNNLTTNQLTSGYYSGEDRVKPNSSKCSHGGVFDGSASGFFGEGINKDSIDCEFSPHNFLHSAAAGVAKEATKQLIRDIKGQITARELKLLLGVGPTLAIAIDTTGSMGPIINSVKSQAIQIVNSRLGTDEEPSKYVLTPFSDPSVGPTTLTDDPDVFKSRINSLFASGGGDCPELSMSGMLQALSASDEGGDLFMFTDASSKDSGLAGAVSSLATSKDIRVYPIAFGSCSPLDPAYIRIANDSGGQVFMLSPSEAANITRLADFVVRSNAVTVLSVGDTFSGGPKTYTAPVDSTMTRVTFSLSGATLVEIKRPDGSIVQPGDAGVSSVSLSSGRIFSITDPATGVWTVTPAGSGEFSLTVSGESTLDLSSFRFVELRGRPGHQGFFPLNGLPVTGPESKVHAVMTEGFDTTNFELRTKTGAPLQSLTLAPIPDIATEFSGDVTPPNASFLAYVTGVDMTGARYQRVRSSIIRPQTVRIAAPPSQDLRPGQTTTYTFRVTNLGASDTFRFTGSDDRGFLRSVNPAIFTLDTGGSVDVAVQLQPPANAVPGTSDTLTVTVQSIGTTGASNFAVVTSNVASPNRAPDCSQATASVTALWPPNHNMHDVSILGLTDPDGDPVTITINQIMQDEPTNDAGDGNTCPDAAGIGTSIAQLRAERSGSGNGRVYVIFFTATDGKGGTCQSSVSVCVPHNNNGSCVEDGAMFDSTVCHQGTLRIPLWLDIVGKSLLARR